jgi:hypothetical protein
MNGRIHNNDEGRWQHPELTGHILCILFYSTNHE